MEPIYEVTRTQVVQIFKAWYAEYLNNPDHFKEITRDDATANGAADEFFRQLNIITENK